MDTLADAAAVTTTMGPHADLHILDSVQFPATTIADDNNTNSNVLPLLVNASYL